MAIIASVVGFVLLFAADLLDLRSAVPARTHKVASLARGVGYGGVGLALACVAFAPGPGWLSGLNFGGSVPKNGAFWGSDAERPLLPVPGAGGGPQTSLLLAFLWIVAAVSLVMLAWTVFFEIGRIRKRRGLAADQLVSEGSYGRCRHPGFWWFVLLALSLGFLKPYASYFITIFVMIILDLTLICVQDYFVFPKLFVGYDEYRKLVPFLVPRAAGRKSKGSRPRKKRLRG